MNGVSMWKNVLLNDTNGAKNDFYEEANYDKTISKEELTKQIEDIASILKEHGFDAAFEQYNRIKTQINSGFSG